jgi:hypothetical protein
VRHQAHEPATKYDTQAARDASVEGRYTYDRQGCPSTVCFVFERKEALAEEFRRWQVGRSQGRWRDDLVRFELGRFNHELEPAAHGMLAFEVERQMFPDDPRFSVLLPRRAVEQPAPAPETVEAAAEAHAMPQPMTEDQVQERLFDLRAQAESIVPPPRQDPWENIEMPGRG